MTGAFDIGIARYLETWRGHKGRIRQRAALDAFLTTLLTATTMLIPLLILTVIFNVNQWLGTHTEHRQITVFLDPSSEVERRSITDDINARIAHYSDVISTRTRFISREDALDELEQHYGQNNVKDAISLLGYNPMHDLIVLHARAEASLDHVVAFIDELSEDQRIFEVDVNKSWLAHIHGLIRAGEYLTALLITIFVIGIWLTIGHTIDQKINRCREEISLKLVLGISSSQLYAPFVLWGTGVGLAGSCIAVLMSAATVEFIENLMIDNGLRDARVDHLIMVYFYCVYTGIVLGAGSAIFAVRRASKLFETTF